MIRQPRVHRPKHLAWLRTLPCVVSGGRNQIEAAHIRFGEPQYGKRSTGMGEKSDDRWTVPLCAQVHRLGPRSQHSMGERKFWEQTGLDICAIAMALWFWTENDEVGEEILREARARRRWHDGNPTMGATWARALSDRSDD